jgi:probable phosphoglycerate mutase
MIVEVWFDGGCRSNPTGAAASAAIVRDPIAGRTLRHVGRAIGVASNNVAEWRGFILGLEAARDLGATSVRAFGDSKLVVEQFAGNYAINAESLRALALEASRLAVSFTGGVVATHVPRAENRAADAICNAVLDGTYVADADDLTAATPAAAKTVTVSFVVDVTMDASEAREAIAGGATELALRKRLADRAERAFLLNGRVGGDSYRATRVKG